MSNEDLKQKILDIMGIVRNLYQSFFDLDKVEKNERTDNVEALLDTIGKGLDDQTLKVGIVGAIKSGKSTFINSFLQSDYLRRGAGVITSVVTRVRSGENLRAVIHFKTMDEINRDIKKSSALFSEDELDVENYDIRDDLFRNRLEMLLNRLSKEKLVGSDSRDADSIYLQSYIKGYEELGSILDKGYLEFSESDFDEYKKFASEEPFAVYVKDILVEVPGSFIDENIEVADCQGSDSTNPLHIARIQDYLLKTNFMVYLISSRTGLRQADIKFLNMLSKMRIMDQSIFVVNADISEHDNLEDLKRVEQNIVEELKLFKDDLKIFPVSALYELFFKNRDSLNEKDILKLKQWELDQELLSYLHDGFLNLRDYFVKELVMKKQFFFYSSCINKLSELISELKKRLDVKYRYLNDEETASDKDFKSGRKKIVEVKNIIENTLEGSKSKYDKELRSDVDHLFDPSSDINKKLNSFVEGYSPDYEQYISISEDGSGKVNYFAFHQDFRQALDSFITSEITPLIVSFVKEKEMSISSYFYRLSSSYEGMVSDAVSKIYDGFISDSKMLKTGLTSPEEMMAMDHMDFPEARRIIDYDISFKSSAIAGKSFVNIKNFFMKIFRKEASFKDDSVLMLKKSMDRLKKNLLSSISDHFLNYRENLKFQYILKFSENVKSRYCEELLRRLDSSVNDIDNLINVVEKDMDRKKEYLSKVIDLIKESDKVSCLVSDLKNSI